MSTPDTHPAISASAISRLLKKNGVNTLPSGISAFYQGVRVSNGVKIRSAVRSVSIAVDLDPASHRHDVVKAIIDLVQQAGYRVTSNPCDAALLTVTRA